MTIVLLTIKILLGYSLFSQLSKLIVDFSDVS